MREGYDNRSVYVCVCLSVCYSASGYILVYMSKMRRCTVSCRLLKIRIVWTSLQCFVQEIWHHLPAMMIGDLALSRQKAQQ